MAVPIRRAGKIVVRSALLTLAVAASVGWAGPSAQSTAKQQVALLPEVRLRKLHLVRPDLIPYPICYEVFC
jgi:hypothetical protein